MSGTAFRASAPSCDVVSWDGAALTLGMLNVPLKENLCGPLAEGASGTDGETMPEHEISICNKNAAAVIYKTERILFFMANLLFLGIKDLF